MTVDYIIIGQGISGTWLSYYLLKENKSIIVIDNNSLQSSSNVAGGLINPVTGRRVVTTWMAEALMPFVWEEYTAIGALLNIDAIIQKNILVFPGAPDLQQGFQHRISENNSYIKTPASGKDALREQFNFPFDVFEIDPCYVVQMRELLQAWRSYLKNKNVLIEDLFDEGQLVFKNNEVQYKDITAKKIIYADGVGSTQSKYWHNMPFVKNKGQALIIESKHLDTSNTYKFGHLALVFLKDNLWWAGSSNELSFSTTGPTENFSQQTSTLLIAILKKPFTIKEHWSSLRAATVERRPFAGTHPVYHQLGILNGMGSKGCSLAPWFAKELAGNLVHQSKIDPLADVQRFHKILSR
jgi:glycine/D-amino acid oxidase-like deaminating enzyme